MKNIGHIWHKEAEIITRSPRTRKNTQRQLKNTKEKINQYIKEKREGNKIKSVVSKLESMDIEVLAKILIDARKTRLLEIQE